MMNINAKAIFIKGIRGDLDFSADNYNEEGLLRLVMQNPTCPMCDKIERLIRYEKIDLKQINRFYNKVYEAYWKDDIVALISLGERGWLNVSDYDRLNKEKAKSNAEKVLRFLQKEYVVDSWHDSKLSM